MLLPLLWVLFQVTNPFRLEVRDEGTSQGRVGAINCSGAGISCSVAAGVGTLSVSGDGGGGGNFVEVELDFGAAPGDSKAVTAVTGQTWVTASSVIVCTPTAFATADREEGLDDVLVEGMTLDVLTRIAGTGFTVRMKPHIGNATGRFKVHCTGA